MDISKTPRQSPWLGVLPLAFLAIIPGCGGSYCDTLGKPPAVEYQPITMVAGTTLTDSPTNHGGAPTSLDVLPNPSSANNSAVGLARLRSLASAAAATPVQDGDLPTGMLLASDGTLTLLPTLPEGTYDIPVQFCNADGCETSEARITVTPPPALGLDYPSGTFVLGSAIPVQTPTLTNPIPALGETFSVTAGTLPPGLTLQGDGTLTGTPGAAGVYTFTVQVANGTRVATSSPVYTVVAPPTTLTLIYPSPVTFTAGLPAPVQIPTLLNAAAESPTFYTLSAGTLPPGMSLQGDGSISGTPTTPGVYTFTVEATNGGPTAASTQVYTVIQGALTLSYPTPVTFQTGVATTQFPTLQGADASLPVTYALVGGTLPPGLTLQADGSLTGTPTTAGVYAVTLQATNGPGTATAFPVYTVVAPAALVLIYPSPVTFIAGLPASVQTPSLQGGGSLPALRVAQGLTVSRILGALGGASLTFAVVEGTLPPGMDLQPDGTITGTPTTGGVYPFTIEAASDGRTATCSPVYTVVELSALGLNYPSPVLFQADVPAAVQVPTVLDADPTLPLTFSLAAGTLPPGLVLQPDGTLTGTPTTPGVYAFTLQVADALRTASSSPVYTVVPSQGLGLNYASPVVFTAGTAAPDQIPGLLYATPGIATTFTLTAGALPPGMALSGTDGSITGTPTTPGVYPLTIQADNGTRSAVSSPVYTVVPAEALVLTYATPLTFPVGSPAPVQSPTIQSTTPGVPLTYRVAAGLLPPGLTLEADGTLDGTPTVPGHYTFTLEVDNGSRSATCAVTNTVVPTQDVLLLYATPVYFPAGSPAPTQSPLALQYLTPGVPVAFQITAGALPSGLALHGLGLIDGTPDTPGVYAFTVQVDNGTRSASFSVQDIVENPQPLTLGYPTPMLFTVGIAIPPQNPAIQNATPGVPLSFSLVQGTLPPGLVLDPNTGRIDNATPAGPTQEGHYVFVVQVINGSRSTPWALDYTVVPAGPLALSYPSPRIFTVGQDLSLNPSDVTPTITNPTPGIPEVFTLVSGAGSFPGGLTLGADGVIQGSPTTEGLYLFTIQIQNGTRSAQAVVYYTVLPAGDLGLSYPTPVTLTAGVPFSQSATVTNDMAAFLDIFTTPDPLPAGLALDSGTGTLSGTPVYTDGSNVTFTIRLTNGPRTAAATLVYRVVWPPAPTYAATTVLVGQTATLLPSNTGGPILSAGLSSGTLPAGATLNANGTIDLDGTTPMGTYAFQVNDCNNDGCVVADVNLTVAGAPVVHYNAMAAFIGLPLTDPPIPGTLSGPIASATLYNDPAPTSPYYSATLPSGLVLDPVTGVISGTPDASNPINQRWDVTIELCNDVGCERVVATLFTVMPQAPNATPTQPLAAPATALAAPATALAAPITVLAAEGTEPLALPRMTYAETSWTTGAFLQVLPTAFGGAATVSTLLDGSLPLGMVLAPDGSLKGLPLWDGTYRATIRSGNAFGSTTAPLTLRIGANAPALAGTAPVAAGAAGSIPAPAADAPGWQLNGSATLLGDALRLTPALPGRTGTAFWGTPVDARNLTVTFDAVMAGGTGGDGLSLIFADADRGGTAGALGQGFGGAGGIKGVGLVLDTWPRSPEDPSTPFLGLTDGFHLLADGAPIWLATRTAPSDLRAPHHVKVVVVNSEATISLDGVPLIRQTLEFPAQAFVGFGASTTAGTDAHDVSNITITWP